MGGSAYSPRKDGTRRIDDIRAANSLPQKISDLKRIEIDERWVMNPNEADFYVDPEDVMKNPVRFVGTGEDTRLFDIFYESGGKYTIDYSSEHIKTVKPSDVETLQPFVLKTGVEEKMKSTSGGVPDVFEFGGKLYVVDGNHRFVAEILNGKKEIPVRITKVIKQ